MTNFGIDISSLNGDINLTMLKDEIDFVIIRCGYGNDSENQDDSRYPANVAQCEALGIPYGVYFYSYALNLQEADSEAAHCLRLLKGRTPSYGVWFDMEDGDGYKAGKGFPSSGTLVAICERFMSKIEEAGYYTGLYASLSWLNGYLNDRRLDRFDKWVAQWASVNTYTGAYGMWQFTDRKYLKGQGPLDGNYAYYDYPALTAGENGKPEEGGEQPLPEGEAMQVIGNGVNFRAGAYVGAQILATLYNNTELIWLWDDGWGWSECIYQGQRGYVANLYLSGWQKLSAYKRARVLGNNVNMRMKPGMDGMVIGQLNWGEEIVVISIDTGNWIRMERNGIYAYIKYDSSYIKIL